MRLIFIFEDHRLFICMSIIRIYICILQCIFIYNSRDLVKRNAVLAPRLWFVDLQARSFVFALAPDGVRVHVLAEGHGFD